jgi:hypothetical protein
VSVESNPNTVYGDKESMNTTLTNIPTWSELDLQPRIVVVADCGYGSFSTTFDSVAEAFRGHFPTGEMTIKERATGHGFPVVTYTIDLQDQERFLHWYAWGWC